MNVHQREYFVYRIVTGKLYHKNFCIHEPDTDDLYKACCIYNSYFEEYKKNNLYNDDDILSIMIEENMWSEDLEFSLLHTLPDELNELKVQLYNIGTTKSADYEIVRNKIDNKKQEIEKLYSKRYSLNNFTCSGMAEYMKMRYLVKSNTYKKNKIYKGNKYSPDYFLKIVNDSFISEKIIRELARNKPWKDMWDSHKRCGAYLFDSDATNLSDNQKRIILWSALYDNIRQHEECPPEFIINNDDMLDGWLYKTNKEEEEERKESAGISNNPKINNSSEIFVITQGSPTEIQNKIEQIRSMNTFQSEVIKKSRVAKIKQEGSVAHQNLPDIKRDLRMQLTNELRVRNAR